MKKTAALLALISALSITGCRSHSRFSEVVKETYIHKYGVPVPQADWESQGKEGQIVSLLKSGVTVAATYKEGILEGDTTYTFPNSSTVHFVEHYSNGQLISKRENYPSGVPLREELYEESTLSKLTRWYEDGTPQAVEMYQNGLLASGEYRTPLNVVESRILEGEGTRISRSNEGDLLVKDTIHQGQMVERMTFYANGDPATVTPFENGVVHGTRFTFLQGGLPRTMEQWAQGAQEGTTVVYQNGEKVAEVPYLRGNKHGIEYRFRDGEFLVEELSWQDNQQHGQRKLFVDGEIKVEWYHHGELVSRNLFERMNLPRRAA